MIITRPMFRVFSLQFGDGSGYFKSSRGRPGFFQRQLSKAHKMTTRQAVRLSCMFNVWLNTVDTLDVNESLRVTLRTCTWKYSGKQDTPQFHCRSRICPWCQGIKILKAERLYQKLRPDAMITREDCLENSRSVFRAPCLTNERLLFTVKNVVSDPFDGGIRYLARVAFFLRSGSLLRRQCGPLIDPEIYEILSVRISLLQQATDYLEAAHKVRNITTCVDV